MVHVLLVLTNTSKMLVIFWAVITLMRGVCPSHTFPNLSLTKTTPKTMKLFALALFAAVAAASATKLIIINNSQTVPGNTTYVIDPR